MAQEATVSRESIEELGGEIANSMENTLEAGSFSVSLPADVQATLKTIEKSFESNDIQDVLSAITKTENIIEKFGINIRGYNESLAETFETYSREKNNAEKEIEELKKKNILADMKFRTKDGQRTMQATILTNKQIEKEKEILEKQFITLEKKEKDNKAAIELYKLQDKSSKQGEKLVKDESKNSDKREELTKRQEQLTLTEQEGEKTGLQAPDLTSGPTGPFFDVFLAPLRIVEDLGQKLFNVGKFIVDFGKSVFDIGKKIGKGFKKLGEFMQAPLKNFKKLGKSLKDTLKGFVGFIAGLIMSTISFIIMNLPMILLVAGIMAIVAALVIFKDSIFGFFENIWNWFKNSKLGKLMGLDKSKDEKEDRKAEKRQEEIKKLEDEQREGGKDVLGMDKFTKYDDKKLMKLKEEERGYQEDLGKREKVEGEKKKQEDIEADKQAKAEEYTAKENEKLRGLDTQVKEKQLADIKTGVITPPDTGSNMPVLTNVINNQSTVGSATVSVKPQLHNVDRSFNLAAGQDV